MSGPETLKLLETAISGGVAFTSWATVGVAIIFTLLLWFFGSYLKRKGDELAIQQDKVLNQLKEQTKITEEIRHQFAVQLE